MQAELASVQAAARQIVDTQQDLIDAIRLEFDDTRPTPKMVRAADVINRVMKTNRVLAGNITLRGAPSRLAFVADERWTERILNNLISNAIWHSGASHILVGARLRGDDIIFEVRDNGRGMPQDTVDQIFEPLKFPSFSPAGYSAARSGLGLYNVRLFTRANGWDGRVQVGARPRHTFSSPTSRASSVDRTSAVHSEAPVSAARTTQDRRNSRRRRTGTTVNRASLREPWDRGIRRQ